MSPGAGPRGSGDDLFEHLGACLAVRSPAAKVEQTLAMARRWSAGELNLDPDATWSEVPVGRPERPQLVEPKQVPRRRLGTPTGHAAFVHAIAHIEFNAINLALDAAHRFRGLPRAYYGDWVQVAAEEAAHFQMLDEHLTRLASAYGAFSAHAGLWAMAEATAGDPLARMALVPRVLEARGLDVTPDMIRRLEAIGDCRGAAILTTIAREEEGHVGVGSRWFKHLCVARSLDPQSAFQALLRQHLRFAPRPPFQREARLRAGFSEAELAALEAMGREW